MEILDSVVSGDTALFIESCGTVIVLSTRGFESRSVSEPISEGEVRASRDGFVESMRVNTSLIRRRIRDYSLRMESMKIGERTKTNVILVYLDSLVDKGVLGELKSRLDRIKVDSILESGYIEELIEDAPLSIFLILITNQMGKDHNNYINFLEGPWTAASIAMGAGLPTLFLLALLIKKKSKKSANNKQKEA